MLVSSRWMVAALVLPTQWKSPRPLSKAYVDEPERQEVMVATVRQKRKLFHGAALLPEEPEVVSKMKWGSKAARNGQVFLFSGTTKSSDRAANGSLQRKKVPLGLKKLTRLKKTPRFSKMDEGFTSLWMSI